MTADFLAGKVLHDEAFHAVVQVLGAMMALGIAGFLLMRQCEKSGAYKLWLACSLLCMGILDAFHASSAPGREFVCLHGTAQLVGGVLIALVWLPERFAQGRAGRILPKVLAAVVALFGLVSLTFPEMLPAMMSGGKFTLAARMLNMIGGILFFVGAAYFAYQYYRSRETNQLLFTACSLMFGVTGITFGLSGLWEAGWWLLHLIRLGAYVLAFGYVSASSTSEYKHLLETEETIARLAAIVESSDDAIMGNTLDGIIVSWNQGAENMYGYSAEEVVGQSISILVPAGCPDEIPEILERIKQGRKVDYFETVHESKDGGQIHVSVSLSLLNDSNGKVIGFSTIARNITKRKKAEEALRQEKEKTERINKQLEASMEQANLMARKAVVADQTKSQFLANMSHEIRTPMNAIIGFSEVLAEENLTDEQRSHVDIIRESAQNLLQLINDILDFSKIEAGKLDTRVIEYSLEQTLASIESLMRPAAEAKGLAFEIAQRSELPGQIHTDPARLRQCLINLIDNAIKFTEKGHVYVNVSLQEVDDKPYVRFDVEDTGIGISPEKQGLIFEEFTQADGGNTRKYSGTGLGLAITKKLANLLGGELAINSEVGRGSVFSLRIPAGVEVESWPVSDGHGSVDKLSKEADTSEQTEFSGNVLVAEDSRTNQMLIKLLLERAGFTVTVAKDGDEVADKALSQPFDLIFMDIQMPSMNGYEATTALREKGITTPIIAVTAYAMKGDDEKCVAAGCDAYLAKPINQQKLLETIRKYLSPTEEAVGEAAGSVSSRPEEPS